MGGTTLNGDCHDRFDTVTEKPGSLAGSRRLYALSPWARVGPTPAATRPSLNSYQALEVRG